MKEYLNEDQIIGLVNQVNSFDHKDDESIEVPKLKRKKIYEDDVLILEQEGNTVFITTKHSDFEKLYNHLINYLCSKTEYSDADSKIIEILFRYNS